MSTGAIIAIIIGVLILLALVALLSRSGRQRKLVRESDPDSKRRHGVHRRARYHDGARGRDFFAPHAGVITDFEATPVVFGCREGFNTSARRPIRVVGHQG